jgi:hypothetical protein
MANRHTNKKLRSSVQRRMALTGETYQQALTALLQARARQPLGSVDLIIAHYFGLPIVLAVFEATEPVGRPIIMRIPSSRGCAVGTRMRSPVMHFRVGGWQ